MKYEARGVICLKDEGLKKILQMRSQTGKGREERMSGIGGKTRLEAEHVAGPGWAHLCLEKEDLSGGGGGGGGGQDGLNHTVGNGVHSPDHMTRLRE